MKEFGTLLDVRNKDVHFILGLHLLGAHEGYSCIFHLGLHDKFGVIDLSGASLSNHIARGKVMYKISSR